MSVPQAKLEAGSGLGRSGVLQVEAVKLGSLKGLSERILPYPMLDVAVLVPIQSRASVWMDPGLRASIAPAQLVAIKARDRFLEHVGIRGAGSPVHSGAHRSLTAVALSTCLERAGVKWRTIDPGGASLRDWRKWIESLRADRPRLVALSSTFVVDGAWLGSLCALVRKILPDARLALGGYYYATNARRFLSMDADIFCIGEGEVRLVRITEAVRDRRLLDDIPGLYLRGADGSLRYTGDVEPLRLDELPLPDWSLAARIHPKVNPERDAIDYAVETQRGCVFKCEFCTFRTLAAPVLGSMEHAVSAIQNVARHPNGAVTIVDATATYPRERFRQVLRRLIERGGAGLALNHYARVSDLDDEVCALMAKAGVRHVLIGQETGDQKLLNAMRKGTRVDQIAPAIAALGRHGIRATMFFIYGFPGETADSLARTRRLIATVNDGHESSPVVHTVRVALFDHQDFAGVHQRDVMRGASDRYGWQNLEISPARAADAALSTYLELSRIMHAPCTGFGVAKWSWLLFGRTTALFHDPAFFRWAKALDRGIGIFVEQELDGTRPNAGELGRLSEQIRIAIPQQAVVRGPVRTSAARAWHRASWRVLEEWSREPEVGVGAITRVLIGWEVGRDTGDLRQALGAVRSGSYPMLGLAPSSEVDATRKEHAERLIQLGIATGRRKLVRAG